MKVPLVVRTAALTLAVILGGGVLADSAVAMSVEKHISDQTRQQSKLQATPRIYVGGLWYTLTYATGHIPTMSVDVLDVDVPQFGVVNARTSIKDIDVARRQVLSGNIQGGEAKLITRTLSLDGVALGQHLHMTDLNISNPYDVSPGGTAAAEVQLQGTPQGFAKPVTVKGTLRIQGHTILLTPTEVDEGADPHDERALHAFTWSMDSRKLPMPTQASRVYVQGGMIYLESEQRNIEVKDSDLSPIAR